MARKKTTEAPAPVEETSPAPVVEETATAPAPAEEPPQAPAPVDEPPVEELPAEESTPPAAPAEEPEKIGPDTPCPFVATVSVSLAVLRRHCGVGTPEMLRPIATLKQGTKVTVTAIQGSNCLLQNGLWTATDYLTR